LSGSADAAVIRERVLAAAPDIVCLTEAYHDFFGGIGHTIHALPDYGYPLVEGRRKVLLWSRNPWRMMDVVGRQGLPPGRFVAGMTETPAGDMHAVGVCIPWAKAHVGSGRRDRASWEDHLAYLNGLAEYLPADPQSLVLLGDFNQRVPRRYQPQHVAAALQRTVLDRLELATGGEIEGMGSQSIDHICHSSDLTAGSLAGISNIGPDNRLVSDHFGVSIRLS
jgi:endonuclease/exonuclease/phosphatase family metal-dependent hydrolase